MIENEQTTIKEKLSLTVEQNDTSFLNQALKSNR